MSDLLASHTVLTPAITLVGEPARSRQRAIACVGGVASAAGVLWIGGAPGASRPNVPDLPRPSVQPLVLDTACAARWLWAACTEVSNRMTATPADLVLALSGRPPAIRTADLPAQLRWLSRVLPADAEIIEALAARAGTQDGTLAGAAGLLTPAAEVAPVTRFAQHGPCSPSDAAATALLVAMLMDAAVRSDLPPMTLVLEDWWCGAPLSAQTLLLDLLQDLLRIAEVRVILVASPAELNAAVQRDRRVAGWVARSTPVLVGPVAHRDALPFWGIPPAGTDEGSVSAFSLAANAWHAIDLTRCEATA